MHWNLHREAAFLKLGREELAVAAACEEGDLRDVVKVRFKLTENSFSPFPPFRR